MLSVTPLLPIPGNTDPIGCQNRPGRSPALNVLIHSSKLRLTGQSERLPCKHIADHLKTAPWSPLVFPHKFSFYNFKLQIFPALHCQQLHIQPRKKLFSALSVAPITPCAPR